MLTLLRAALVAAGLLLIFGAFGSCLAFWGKRGGKTGAAHAVLYGFLLYYALFELVSFPMMLAMQSLRRLSILWAVLSVGFVVFSLVRCIGEWKECFVRWKRHWFHWPVSFWILLLLLAVQVWWIAASQGELWDASYYVANVSTNVATNTINCYEPFTGAPRGSFYLRYLFSMYPASNSVLCDLTGISPLLLTKTVLSVLMLLLSYLVYFLIGMKLFKGKRSRVYTLLCFISVLNLNFASEYSASSFLLNRGYEGKSILACILLPMVFYLGLQLYDDPDRPGTWVMLFLLTVAGMDVSMSSMGILPAALSAVILPVLAVKRHWKGFLYYGICMAVPLLCFLVYYLAGQGMLTFAITGLAA